MGNSFIMTTELAKNAILGLNIGEIFRIGWICEGQDRLISL